MSIIDCSLAKFNSIFRSEFFLKILISLLLMPVILFLILDYYIIESPFVFDQYFFFEGTWKGILFYLIAAWLIFIEFSFGAKMKEEKEIIGWKSCLVLMIFALIPLFYVISEMCDLKRSLVLK